MPREEGNQDDDEDDGDDRYACGSTTITSIIDDDRISLCHERSFPRPARHQTTVSPIGYWSAAGCAGALACAALAWHKSRARGGFYDAHVYGMSPATHRRYAWAFCGFAALFAVLTAARIDSVVALGALTLAAVFYGASFLRGAEERE